MDYTVLTENIGDSALGSNAQDISWSPDGRYLTISHASAPHITTWKFDGVNFTKLPTISVDPGGAPKCTWSKSGQFLAVGSNTSPYFFVYSFDGTSFTKLSNPASLPGASVVTLDWNNDDSIISVGSASSLINYSLTGGTTLTRMTNPATSPGAGVRAVAWRPDGTSLIVGMSGSGPFQCLYTYSGGVFTKQAMSSASAGATVASISWRNNNLFAFAISGLSGYLYGTMSGNTDSLLSVSGMTGVATNNNCVRWSPDGKSILFTSTTSATNFTRFAFDGTSTFSKYADPLMFNTADSAYACSWHPSGDLFALATFLDPKVVVYRKNRPLMAKRVSGLIYP